MAREIESSVENPSSVPSQIATFLQNECGYEILQISKDENGFEKVLELERRIGENRRPRFHIYVDLPNSFQAHIGAYFETNSGNERRTKSKLQNRGDEIKRILSKIENVNDSVVHRMLRSALNELLLFQTSNVLEAIRRNANHDLKQELLTAQKSSRLRKASRSQFLRMK